MGSGKRCKFDGLVQDCTYSSANAMELLHSSTKPSTTVEVKLKSPLNIFWSLENLDMIMWKKNLASRYLKWLYYAQTWCFLEQPSSGVY